MSFFDNFSTKKGSEFRQNFLKVARANVIVQGISLLIVPILTRLYSPEDFGMVALFNSTLSILLSFATAKFSWSIPNTKSEKQSAGLVIIGIVSLGIVSIIAYVILYYLSGNKNIHFFEKLETISSYLWLLPIAIVGGGLRELFETWHVRQSNLTPVSRAKIYQSVVQNTLYLVAGFAGLGPKGLIGSLVISTWIGIGTLVKYASNLLPQFRMISSRLIKVVFKKYRSEAAWSTSVSIVNSLSLNTPVFLLTYLFAANQVGKYAVMYRLAAVPISLFMTALSQSFWAKAAEMSRNKQYKSLSKLYKKTTLYLILPSILILVFCATAPFFINFILGKEKWQGAGEVLFAMTPMFIGMILFSPTNHLTVFGRQRVQAFADLSRLILMIAVAYVSNKLDLTFVQTVFLLSNASMLGHFIMFFVHLREHRFYCKLEEV